jgi:signal transduction histidine kinase
MMLKGIKLSVKLPALIMFSVCLTALASGLFAILIGRSVVRERAFEANINSVQSYASAVELYIDNAKSTLELAAALKNPDPSSRRDLARENNPATLQAHNAERVIAAEVLKHSKVFEYVMLLRPDGSIYLTEPRDHEQVLSRPDLGFTEWYNRLFSTRKMLVSDLCISVITQRPSVIVATPVFGSNGRLTGIWAGGLRLDELSKIGHGGMETGPLERWGYITDSRGLIVAHQTNPKYVQEQTDFSSDLAVQAAIWGQRGARQWFNALEETEQLGAYMPMKDLGWAVVYVTPTNVAYAPIDTLTRTTLLISIALFLIMSSVGWVMARKATRPLKDLASATDEIAAGNYGRRVNVKTLDEIGQVAGKFNQMAEALLQKEAQVLENNEQLQQANRLKSEFLANMSHELRTPLNGIIGFTQMMYDGKLGPVSEQNKEYLGDILTSANHLLQLINDVLDLAKVEAGKMEFQPTQISLRAQVQETCDIVRALAAKKRLTIETDLAPEVDSLWLDAGKIRQVLYNYISNAIKFTPDGGKIVVRAAAESATEFRLSVEDTGIGIKPGDLERLFIEFQQLDSGTAKNYQGTGLGLALTKRIVQAQGGTVGVTSVWGKGSTFFAILPRRSGGEPEGQEKLA